MEHERLDAAESFLRSHLENLIQQTSYEYHYGVWRQPDPQAEADFAREIIQDCKGKSLDRIADCFDRFLHALGESHTLQERVSRAKDLSWKIINSSFSWTSGDGSDYRVFAEWIGSRDPIMTGELNLPRNPVGTPWDCVAQAISYDFWTGFDRLLNQLADDRLSALPSYGEISAPSSRNPPTGSRTVKDESPGKQYGDPDLDSRDKLTRCKARARFVAGIKRELDILRPHYFSENDFDRLAKERSQFVTFKVCADRKELRESLGSLQEHKQYVWLAKRIAAAGLGKKAGTIDDNWRRYKKFL